MQHQEGRFQGSGNVEIYYQSWHPLGEAKAALLIVHGLGEHSGRYRHVVEHLVPRGYGVYTFDLRGFGRSGGQRGHVNSMAEYHQDIKAMRAIIQEAEAGKKVFMMGHSMGALIMLAYLLRYPDDLCGFIASGTALEQSGISPLLVLAVKVLSRLAPRFNLKSGLEVAAISRNPAVVEAYRSDPLVHDVVTPRLGMELLRTKEWVNAHLTEITLPFLVLHGGADRIIPSLAGRRLYEKATSTDKEYIEYEGGYHEPHNDLCYAQAVADLEGWLDRQVCAGASLTAAD